MLVMARFSSAGLGDHEDTSHVLEDQLIMSGRDYQSGDHFTAAVFQAQGATTTSEP